MQAGSAASPLLCRSFLSEPGMAHAPALATHASLQTHAAWKGLTKACGDLAGESCSNLEELAAYPGLHHSYDVCEPPFLISLNAAL
jgi:hypothetical protein